MTAGAIWCTSAMSPSSAVQPNQPTLMSSVEEQMQIQGRSPAESTQRCVTNGDTTEPQLSTKELDGHLNSTPDNLPSSRSSRQRPLGKVLEHSCLQAANLHYFGVYRSHCGLRCTRRGGSAWRALCFNDGGASQVGYDTTHGAIPRNALRAARSSDANPNTNVTS